MVGASNHPNPVRLRMIHITTEKPAFTSIHADPQFSFGHYSDRLFLVALRLARPNVSLIQQDSLCDVKLRFNAGILGRLAGSWTPKIRSQFDANAESGKSPQAQKIVFSLYRDGQDIYWSINGASFLLGSAAHNESFGLHPQMMEFLLPISVMDRFASRATALLERGRIPDSKLERLQVLA